jgi:predicted transcriptional regulator
MGTYDIRWEILKDPEKIKLLRVIEKPTNISSPLEIAVETGVAIDKVEETLRELEDAALVRQEKGLYGITLQGMDMMKKLKMK